MNQALQVIAAGLLIVTVFMYWDLSKRHVDLNSGIKEDGLWAMYQLDRETHRLANALDDAQMASQSEQRAKEISLRYDILYSRVNLLGKKEYKTIFAQNGGFSQFFETISKTIHDTENWADKIAKNGTLQADELGSFASKIRGLTGETEKFLLETNNQISTERADARERIIVRERNTIYIMLLFIAAVMALIYMLNRQITKARASSLALEKMASELESAYHGAQAGYRAKSSFLATISHEIRTPLNAILGLCELLMERHLQADVRKDVGTIQASGEALLEILNEVLDFSKLESGEKIDDVSNFDGGLLIQSVVDILRPRAREKGLKIEVAIGHRLKSHWIRTESTNIRQILLNLISNAVKFTETGLINVAGDIVGDLTDSRLVLTVADTGIGIAEDGLSKLFKPFSQVDSSINRKFGGTGLGLSICKLLAEKSGGTISVESEIGKGTRFTVEIPVEQLKTEEKSASEAAKQQRLVLPRHKILLVEDNATSRQVALRLLEQLGQSVVTAIDGNDAIRACASSKFDMILMDMQMPEKNGIEATIEICTTEGPNKLTPIIAMTANASEAHRRMCLEAGMKGFESKPIRKQRLIDLISGLAEVKKPDAPIRTNESAQGMNKNVSLLIRIDPQRHAELLEELGEATYSAIWAEFHDDSVALVALWQNALHTKDTAAARNHLHALKGACCNVGLLNLADRLEQLRSEDCGTVEFSEIQQAFAKVFELRKVA